MMAMMISAVTASFGTAERTRCIRDAIPRVYRGEGAGAGFGPAANSGLEAFDLVPQGAVLAFVSRPYFLLCHFPELVHLGFHHGHAERLQLRFGFREIVDRFGC